MKKALLLLASFSLYGLSLCAQEAHVYTDNIVVTVNDESSPSQPSDINVLFHQDGKSMDLTLKNFVLSTEDDAIGVGNITLTDIPLTEVEKGRYTFQLEQIIKIAEGEGESPSGIWLGPELPDIPIVLKGEIDSKKIYATIDIDMMDVLEQMIYVVVGTPFPEITNCIRTNVSVKKAQNQVIDLAGRRVSGSKKGIYVVNGKKVVVR